MFQYRIFLTCMPFECSHGSISSLMHIFPCTTKLDWNTKLFELEKSQRHLLHWQFYKTCHGLLGQATCHDTRCCTSTTQHSQAIWSHCSCFGDKAIKAGSETISFQLKGQPFLRVILTRCFSCLQNASRLLYNNMLCHQCSFQKDTRERAHVPTAELKPNSTEVISILQ